MVCLLYSISGLLFNKLTHPNPPLLASQCTLIWRHCFPSQKILRNKQPNHGIQCIGLVLHGRNRRPDVEAGAKGLGRGQLLGSQSRFLDDRAAMLECAEA